MYYAALIIDIEKSKGYQTTERIEEIIGHVMKLRNEKGLRKNNSQ